MKKIATILTIFLAIVAFSFDTKVKKVSPKHGVIILALGERFVTKEFVYAGSAWFLNGESIEFNDMLGRRTILRIGDINGIVELDSAHSVVKRVQ